MNKWLIFRICSFLVVTVFAAPSLSARLGEPCEHHSDCIQEVRSHHYPWAWHVTAAPWSPGVSPWAGHLCGEQGAGGDHCAPHTQADGQVQCPVTGILIQTMTQPKTYATGGFSRISKDDDREGSPALPGQGILVKVTDAWRQGSSAENYKGRCPEFKTCSQK